MVLHLEERGCRRARRFPVETIERLFELGGEPMPIASIRSPFGYRLIDAPD
jgi:hypothetical protein